MEKCRVCNGEGTVICECQYSNQEEDCYECDGVGIKICLNCNGTGEED